MSVHNCAQSRNAYLHFFILGVYFDASPGISSRKSNMNANLGMSNQLPLPCQSNAGILTEKIKKYLCLCTMYVDELTGVAVKSSYEQGCT